MAFERDGVHWLFQRSPGEWIAEALGELARATRAYAGHDARGGLACAKRAAGMALNGALIVEPNPSWGRSYVDHLRALGRDASVPPAVRSACALLLATPAPGGVLVSLGTPGKDHAALEAARDVMAHAYAKVKRNED